MNSSQSTTFKATVPYDPVKSALEHVLEFWLGGNGPTCIAVDPSTLKVVIERRPADTSTVDYARWFTGGGNGNGNDNDNGNGNNNSKMCYSPALKLGPCRDGMTGLLAIQFDSRGAYVPKLPMSLYGPEHTYIGNSLLKTKRVIIDGANYPPTSFAVLFGYHLDEFPDGLRSCELAQPTLDDMGSIRLLAEGSYLPIEPAGGRRFYTPLAEPEPVNVNDLKANRSFDRDLYSLGIIMLGHESLEELLRAFNPGFRFISTAAAMYDNNNNRPAEIKNFNAFKAIVLKGHNVRLARGGFGRYYPGAMENELVAGGVYSSLDEAREMVRLAVSAGYLRCESGGWLAVTDRLLLLSSSSLSPAQTAGSGGDTTT